MYLRTVLQVNIAYIGGGAASFFSAAQFADINNPPSILILEKSSSILSKVRISGGGRCNVTNSAHNRGDLRLEYPRGGRSLKGLFHRFTSEDTIEWFRKNGVKMKTESDGRMFPVTDKSGTIIHCLTENCRKAGVEISLNRKVLKLSKSDGKFLIETDKDNIEAQYVVIACGGAPKPDHYAWIKELGIQVCDPYPSLFSFNLPGNPLYNLSGLSVQQARVQIKGLHYQTEGPLLITHNGISGPAVLRMSAYAAGELRQMEYQADIRISWTGTKGAETTTFLEKHLQLHPSKKISNHRPENIPTRLWEYLCMRAGIAVDILCRDISKKSFHKLCEVLENDTYEMKGKTTNKEEFVSAGGVELTEIDLKTMESKRIENLFFAGEILDIDGITGGYNFQAAWSAGYIISEVLKERHSESCK